MMLPTLLARIVLSIPQDPTEAGRVMAFVTAARVGLEPETVLPPYAEPKERPRYADFLTNEDFKRRGIRVYRYNLTDTHLNIRTGRIEFYSDSSSPYALRNPDGTLAPRRVTDAQAAALAQRFYTAAGWPGGIRPFEFEDGQGGNEQSVLVRYVPTAGGVPYHDDWQGLVYVNRKTGQLDDFHSPPANLPAPPSSLAPQGSLQQARLVALGFGIGVRGESMAEAYYDPLRLCVWYPAGYVAGDQRPIAQRGYGPTVRAALAANRGILAYSGLLLGGSRNAGLYVTLDARTGEILDRSAPLPEGGAGGAGGGTPAANVSVPSAPRPWRVATGKDGWGAWTLPADAALASVATKPPVLGRKLALSDGKAAFRAVYDPKANLLGIEGKAYRPGPALASLLRRKGAGRT